MAFGRIPEDEGSTGSQGGCLRKAPSFSPVVVLSREAKASHSKRPMDGESNQHRDTGTSPWRGAEEASGNGCGQASRGSSFSQPARNGGQKLLGPSGLHPGQGWKLGSCRLRWPRRPCAHLSERNWVCHCLGRKENKQLSQTGGIRFQLNSSSDSHAWATCFWILTHLPGNPPSLHSLKTKTGNIRKSFHSHPLPPRYSSQEKSFLPGEEESIRNWTYSN